MNSLRLGGAAAPAGPPGRPVAATSGAVAWLMDSLIRPPRWRSESAFADAQYLPIRSQARSCRGPLHAQPRPRVDRDEHQVNDEVREQDADDDEDEDALQQEVVLGTDRLEDQVAEAGELEGDLGDYVAADDHAELEREPGQLRQRRVPVRVPADHPLA